MSSASSRFAVPRTVGLIRATRTSVERRAPATRGKNGDAELKRLVQEGRGTRIEMARKLGLSERTLYRRPRALRGGLIAILAAVLFGAGTPLVQRFGAGLGSFSTAVMPSWISAEPPWLSMHGLRLETLMHSRRKMLARSAQVAGMLAAVGLLPGLAHAQAVGYNTAAFDAKTMAEVMKALGSAAPVESKDVTITGPDIAENGAVVPVGAATSLTGVKRLLLLVEKNPAMLSAIFDVSDAVEPNFSTRVKMGQSSNVFAVAMMADGKVLYAAKEVKVTLGGCGG